MLRHRITRSLLLAAASALVVGITSALTFAAGGGGGAAPAGGGGGGGGGPAAGVNYYSKSTVNSWLGALIMPRSETLRIQDSRGQAVGGIYDLAWPAGVFEINGRWLHIKDDGGYSVPGIDGWVYADDVVKLDDAFQFYSKALQTNPSPVLYWLRGIYWETQNESAVALNDYRAARDRNKPLTIDDIAIRTGRLLAAAHLHYGELPYQPPDEWEQQFKDAEAVNNRRPQLYLDWGLAESQKCRSNLTGSQARADAQDQGSKGLTAAKYIEKLVNGDNGAKDMQDKLVATAGKNDQEKTIAAAKKLVNRLQIATNFAAIRTEFIDELAAKAAEFKTSSSAGGAPLPPVYIPIPPLEPQPVQGNDAATTAINALVKAANDAASAGSKLGKAAQAAIAAAGTASPPPTASQAQPVDAVGAAALTRFGQARALNPNWWRVSMALGELVLNHYERQTLQGDMARRQELPRGFCNALEEFMGHQDGAAELVPPGSVASNNVATTASAKAKQPAGLTDDQVLAFAKAAFDQAIGQNPDSMHAYRNRAEVQRLQAELDSAGTSNLLQQSRHHLTQAQQSATQACAMGAYREPSCLRTLAQVQYDLKLYGPAADLAQRSLSFLSPEERPLYEPTWEKYASVEEEAGIADQGVAASGPGIGVVAMRGESNNAKVDEQAMLHELLKEFSISASDVSIQPSNLEVVRTRGEGDKNEGSEVRVVRRARRLPAGFVDRAP